MKTLLSLAVLSALLSACGTGILPPVTKDLDDIKVTLPDASSALPGVVYLSTNQFATLPDLASVVSSVEATGDLVYTSASALTSLNSVGVYIRANLDGQNCYNSLGYLICSGDESANKLQDLNVTKGQIVKTTLKGAVLNKAVQSKTGYIGFKINDGNTVKGDRIEITGIKATIRF